VENRHGSQAEEGFQPFNATDADFVQRNFQQ
jgi:hypothetical protein